MTVFAVGLAVGYLFYRFAGPAVQTAARAEGPADPTTPAKFRSAGRRTDDGWGHVVVRASTGRDLGIVFPGGLGERPAETEDGERGSLHRNGDLAPREWGEGLTAPGPADEAAPQGADKGGRRTLDPIDGSSRPTTDTTPPTSTALPDFEHTVRNGQTLSEICAGHYGTAAPGLVQALATYNGLRNPDELRAGVPIALPDRAVLDELR
ncbi:MAG: LysM domain-containing protein [Planctomycetota bacterium]